MRSLTIILNLLLASSSAWAGEQKLSGTEIQLALNDHTYGGVGEEGKSWEQIFQKSGVTFYATGGAQSQGKWEVRGDQYCSQWPPNEAWACYDVMVAENLVIIFVSASGTRYTGHRVN